MNPNPLQLRRTSTRRTLSHRRAMTLIEILVVMAIILVLMGLFIAGLKQWGDSAKRNVTMTRLEMLNAMLSELDAAGHNQFTSQWFFNPAVRVFANAFGNVAAEAQFSPPVTYLMTTSKGPLTVTNSRNVALAYMTASPQQLTVPLIAPFLTPQVLLAPVGTVPYGIQNKLMSLPNNAKAMAGLPSGAVATLAPGAIAGYPPAGSPPAQPVVLDGWGNPILFCPSGGLGSVCLNVKVTPSLTSPQPPAVVTSPDGRPFWASAGPDGDFVKGDDNIYSFQQQ
jgi:prepilin-type N-terminal cleavage/methylation domain-containing protein